MQIVHNLWALCPLHHSLCDVWSYKGHMKSLSNNIVFMFTFFKTMKRSMPCNTRGNFQDNISIFLVEPQSDCISLLQASVIANSFNQRMLLLHNAVSNVSGLFINLKPHDLNNVGATHISYTKYVIVKSLF